MAAIDAQHCRFLSTQPATAAIIAAAFSGGQPRDGVDHGPRALIDNGLVAQLSDLGWTVNFDGRIQTFEEEVKAAVAKAAGTGAAVDAPVGILKKPRSCGAVCRSVARQVEAAVRDKQLAVTIGGDHSLGLGTVYGTSRVHADVCVIWVDAHADINTPATTQSGNIHGMPVSWLLGMSPNTIPGFEWLDAKPALTPDRIVYIGLRDVDAGEKRLLKEQGIKAFSMHEVDRYGIGKVVEMAVDHVNPDRTRPVHLSFDVDALDPSVAPSTGTPVRGGLTFREGHYICEALWETGLLVAVDIMEVNPTLGDAAQHLQTTQIGCSLIRSSLGETLL